MTVKITKDQFQNSKELFKLTDRLRRYISDKTIESEDPDTGEKIELHFDDNDTTRVDVYRRNRWIMECKYYRNGTISDFQPVSKW